MDDTVETVANAPADAADAVADATTGNAEVSDVPGPAPAGAVTDVATIVKDTAERILEAVREGVNTVVPETVQDAADETVEAIAQDSRPLGKPWTHFNPFGKRDDS